MSKKPPTIQQSRKERLDSLVAAKDNNTLTHEVSTPHPGGRPTVMTKDVLDKLIYCFSIGATDGEARLYAGINTDTMYHYQASHPEFSERKARLKQAPILKAKSIVINALDKNDKDMGKWYLERKARSEFGRQGDGTIVAVQVNIDGTRDKFRRQERPVISEGTS